MYNSCNNPVFLSGYRVWWFLKILFLYDSHDRIILIQCIASDVDISWFPRVIHWTNGRLRTFEGNQLYVLGHQSVNKALKGLPLRAVYHILSTTGATVRALSQGFFFEDVDTRWGDWDRLLILNTLTTWRWCIWGIHNIVCLLMSNVIQLLLADYRYMHVYFSTNCSKRRVTLVMELPYYTYSYLDVPVANKT